MSNHVYWDLSGRFDGTALRQALKIAADQVTINDENHLITKLVPEKAAFDFAILSTPTALITTYYSHSFPMIYQLLYFAGALQSVLLCIITCAKQVSDIWNYWVRNVSDK